MDDSAGRDTEPARGRRPSTTREHIARQALALFDRHGFEATTVDDIATSVGIGRRTFFRYYQSKLDVVWGEFDAELVRLADQLGNAPDDEPMMDVLRRSVVATNRFGAGELDELRIRMALISTVPALVAHSALRYAEWCEVVAGFAARRMGAGPDDLTAEVDRAFRLLATGFDDAGVERWHSGSSRSTGA